VLAGAWRWPLTPF